MGSEVCMDKSTGLSDDLDHPDQQKCKPDEEWPFMAFECTSSLGR